MHISRRRALAAAAFPLLPKAAAQVTPDLVRFHPETEPLVVLLETTPRDKCPAMLIEQLASGVSYRQLLAALYLAGVRNVNPRPPGFALHCLFIIHAAHLLSLEAPAEMRTLPLFFALDQFKASQERDSKSQTGDYSMHPLTGTLPSAKKAVAEFHAAMEAWDQERAERAIAVIARNRGFNDTFELLWRYGIRDQRNIGHKAIFVANTCRTLQTMGWHHAEPVLRSLVLGLLDFGKETKVDGYAFEDQTYLSNLNRLGAAISNDFFSAKPATNDARETLELLRANAPLDACAALAAKTTKGMASAGVWDGIHLYAGELTMRTAGPGIITGIHAVSAVNGLHYIWQAAADPKTRFLTLLRAAGWLGQFRRRAENRKDVRTADITAIGEADKGPGELFRRASTMQGRRHVVNETIRNTIPKANEVHFYKFPAAIIEDLPLVSAEWRPHMTAVLSYYTKTSSDPDIAPIRAAKGIA